MPSFFQAILNAFFFSRYKPQMVLQPLLMCELALRECFSWAEVKANDGVRIAKRLGNAEPSHAGKCPWSSSGKHPSVVINNSLLCQTLSLSDPLGQTT